LDAIRMPQDSWIQTIGKGSIFAMHFEAFAAPRGKVPGPGREENGTEVSNFGADARQP